MNEALLVLGMCAVTFGVRYPVLALISKIPLPDRLFQALRYVPPAVLSAIILPEVINAEGGLHLSLDNARLIGAAVAALVAWRTKNLLLTIVLGMLAMFAWQWLVGVVRG